MAPDKISRLQASIAAKRAAVREAQTFKDSSLVAALGAAATAKEQAEAEAALDQADAEITALRRRLADLERALEIAEKENSRAKQVERFELAKRSKEQVDSLGIAIEAEVDKLLSAIDGIRPIVETIAALGRDRIDAAHSIVRECSVHPERDWNEVYCGALTGQNYRGILADAVYASGLARIGISLAPFVEVTPARNETPIEEIRERDRNAVARRLTKLLKAREAQIHQPTKEQDK